MPERNNQFVRLMSKHHQVIWSYIMSLHPNRADADDIMQETASSLWNRFADYDEKKGDFLPWAFRFAYYEILKFRKTQSRSKLLFNESLLEKISTTQAALVEEIDPRTNLLSSCIKKLALVDQQLIERRYDHKTTIAALSYQLNQPVKRLYKRLEKIRIILFRCVDHQLNKGSAS